MTGVTPTRAIERPETDAEHAARAESLRLMRLRSRLGALAGVVPPRSYERAFARRDPASLDAGELRLVDRLLWHYRRLLPRHLAPTLPPDDPIVMQDRAAELADA